MKLLQSIPSSFTPREIEKALAIRSIANDIGVDIYIYIYAHGRIYIDKDTGAMCLSMDEHEFYISLGCSVGRKDWNVEHCYAMFCHDGDTHEMPLSRLTLCSDIEAWYESVVNPCAEED